jgi:hypothetical protein
MSKIKAAKKYVKMTDPNNLQGEITGLVDVAPVTEGTAQNMTPHNITDTGQAELYWQNPDDLGQTLVAMSFSDLNEASNITASLLSDLSAYDPISYDVLTAFMLEIDKVFADEGDALSFLVDAAFQVGDTYVGDGSDLLVLHWTGSAWDELTVDFFNPTTGMAYVDGLDSFSPFAVTVIPEPASLLLLGTGGLMMLRRRR